MPVRTTKTILSLHSRSRIFAHHCTTMPQPLPADLLRPASRAPLPRPAWRSTACLRGMWSDGSCCWPSSLFSPLRAQSWRKSRYDAVIRNGRIIDGTGNPWFRGDVAILDDRIAAVGDLSAMSGRREIDASGLWVAPGFIDSHSHAGPGLASAGLSHSQPLIAQGLTLVIINPDGGGAVDLARQRAQLLEHGLGVNVAQLVPHGSLRREIVGSGDRAPTPTEMDQMREAVRLGMRDGGFGLSSGTFYAPGSFSDPSEIVELGKVVAEFGGVYASHIRDESDYSVGVIKAVEEVVEVGRQAAIPVVITHVKALGPPVWGYGGAIVRRVQMAREEGVEVYTDQYPYSASATGLGAALLPRWAEAGGADSLLARLDDPEPAGRIRAAMLEQPDSSRRSRPDPASAGCLRGLP